MSPGTRPGSERMGIGNEALLERIAELEEALGRAYELLSDMGWHGPSFCEWCEKHAPSEPDGSLLGPVPHAENCGFIIVQHALRAAGGDGEKEER